MTPSQFQFYSMCMAGFMIIGMLVVVALGFYALFWLMRAVVRIFQGKFDATARTPGDAFFLGGLMGAGIVHQAFTSHWSEWVPWAILLLIGFAFNLYIEIRAGIESRKRDAEAVERSA